MGGWVGVRYIIMPLRGPNLQVKTCIQTMLDSKLGPSVAKIRGYIRGIFMEKRGNTIETASNTGRKIKIENVYQLHFCISVKNILILNENESKYGTATAQIK